MNLYPSSQLIIGSTARCCCSPSWTNSLILSLLFTLPSRSSYPFLHPQCRFSCGPNPHTSIQLLPLRYALNPTKYTLFDHASAPFYFSLGFRTPSGCTYVVTWDERVFFCAISGILWVFMLLIVDLRMCIMPGYWTRSGKHRWFLLFHRLLIVKGSLLVHDLQKRR